MVTLAFNSFLFLTNMVCKGLTGLGTTDTVTLPARLQALDDHCVTQVTITHESGVQ